VTVTGIEPNVEAKGMKRFYFEEILRTGPQLHYSSTGHLKFK
jgi:hypothetical protein